MARLDEFREPMPWPALAGVMVWVNRILMLHGVPLLRDVPLLNRIPGIRGLTGIRHIIADQKGFDRLKTLVNSGEATFILPNHPEFFTDWMLDKDVIARAAPAAASWATNGIVNGMGPAMQKFWLWNNLIAQIPGNSVASKNYSVHWALKGKGVLLHPEGLVGWHPEWIGPLMPGAAEMARQCAQVSERKAWLQPLVWKIIFTGDVQNALAREIGYVERRLKLDAGSDLSPAVRTAKVYRSLLDRELTELGLQVSQAMSLKEKRETVTTVLSLNLAQWLGLPTIAEEPGSIVAKARKHARNLKAKGTDVAAVILLADRLQRHLRLGEFAFASHDITQEETAAHIKRLRNDWCKGTVRDTMNAFLPQPAGKRSAHVRFCDPIEISAGSDPAKCMQLVRSAMQAALDGIGDETRDRTAPFAESNPFISA